MCHLDDNKKTGLLFAILITKKIQIIIQINRAEIKKHWFSIEFFILKKFPPCISRGKDDD
jgi:hypothetical protein